MKKILIMGLSLVTLFSAAPAQAALITAANIGQSGSITFDGNVGGTPVPQLQATVDFTLLQYNVGTNGTIVFDVSVDNTSTIDSRLTAFGFNTNPDVTGGTTSGAVEFTGVVTGGSTFPNNFGAIDLCLKGGQLNNCSGGTGAGLAPTDAPDTFQLTLTFANLTAAGVDFSNFGSRWQAITGAGYNGASGTGSGTPGGVLFCVTPGGCTPPPPPPPPIPEPTTLVMLGMGLIGAAYRMRR